MKLMDINLNVLIEGHGTQTVKFLQQVSLDTVSHSKYAETGMTTREIFWANLQWTSLHILGHTEQDS